MNLIFQVTYIKDTNMCESPCNICMCAKNTSTIWVPYAYREWDEEDMSCNVGGKEESKHEEGFW